VVNHRSAIASVAAVAMVVACSGGGSDGGEAVADGPPEVASDVPDEPDEPDEDEGPSSELERGDAIEDGPTVDDGPSVDEGSDDDGGGLTRSDGSSGSTLESGGVVEAPALDRSTIDLFTDLDAGASESGTVVEVADDVLFDFDEVRLRPEADEVLDDLAELADGTGEVPIAVVGHTDGVGDDDYNLDLSQRRAEAVVEGFVGRGVDADRLSADGRGSSEPVAEEGGDDDEQARARNRRVEVTFEGVDRDG
jgi:outer membrane protein OmpA-like peptidoglycan-associated protein